MSVQPMWTTLKKTLTSVAIVDSNVDLSKTHRLQGTLLLLAKNVTLSVLLTSWAKGTSWYT